MISRPAPGEDLENNQQSYNNLILGLDFHQYYLGILPKRCLVKDVSVEVQDVKISTLRYRMMSLSGKATQEIRLIVKYIPKLKGHCVCKVLDSGFPPR